MMKEPDTNLLARSTYQTIQERYYKFQTYIDRSLPFIALIYVQLA